MAGSYLWSTNRKDLERVPIQGWIGFLEGNPAKALQADMATIRRRMQQVEENDTTPDTRLADYLTHMSPSVI